MEEYILLDIGKIVIVRNGYQSEYYKEEDGLLDPLTEQERAYVDSLFEGGEDDTIWYSQLSSCMDKNSQIELREWTLSYLSYLERLIPPQYREDLYRNIETLTTQLNLNCDWDTVPSLPDDGKPRSSGGYNIKKNAIELYPSSLKLLYEKAQKEKNPQYFWQNVLSYYAHELTHMSSSHYDSQTQTSYVGFDCYTAAERKYVSHAFTEGMTDYIAKHNPLGTDNSPSGYYFEVTHFEQLAQLVGVECLLDAYYGHKGLDPIIEKLSAFTHNRRIAEELFKRIGDHYHLRIVSGLSRKQSIFAMVQFSMVQFLEQKLRQAKENHTMSEQDIQMAIRQFESTLFTKEKLKKYNANPDHFIGLRPSLDAFKKVKAEFHVDDTILLPTSDAFTMYMQKKEREAAKQESSRSTIEDGSHHHSL